MDLKKLFTITLTLITIQSFGQNLIDSLNISGKLDTLKSQFSNNKKLTPNYEVEILTALSYYPELSNTKIKFKEAKIKTTLNARPAPVSVLFRRKKKRKYVIRINSQFLDSVIHLSHISFNAKIGVFGHEFAHIYDYQNRNIWGIASRLIAYSSKKSKSDFEKEIDTFTIQRGLGWQLYEWSNYVLNTSNATKAYKEFKRLTYLTPEEIKSALNKL